MSFREKIQNFCEDEMYTGPLLIIFAFVGSGVILTLWGDKFKNDGPLSEKQIKIVQKFQDEWRELPQDRQLLFQQFTKDGQLVGMLTSLQKGKIPEDVRGELVDVNQGD